MRNALRATRAHPGGKAQRPCHRGAVQRGRGAGIAKQPASSMATSTASVAYRPVRLGLLVRENEISDLVRASEFSALLWGGIRNPIIPVSSDLSLARRLIEVFSVDVLVCVNDSEELKAFANEFPYLRTLSMGDGLFYEDWVTKGLCVKYLDVINLINYVWNDELRHQPKSERSNCVLVEWSPDDPLACLFAMQFGHYPSDLQLSDDFKQAFTRGLKAHVTEIPLEGNLDASLHTRVTPLELTTQVLGATGRGRVESGIYFGEPSDFLDLLSFWNVRAAGARLYFVPHGHAERCALFLTAYLRQLDEHSPRSGIDNSVALFVRQPLASEIPEFVNSAVTKRHKALHFMDPALWNGLNILPHAYHFGWSSVLANVDQSFGKPVVSLGLPAKHFIPESLDRQDLVRAYNQQLAVSIDMRLEFSHPGRTLSPPYLRRLNEFYSREIAIDPFDLRVEKGWHRSHGRCS